MTDAAKRAAESAEKKLASPPAFSEDVLALRFSDRSQRVLASADDPVVLEQLSGCDRLERRPRRVPSITEVDLR